MTTANSVELLLITISVTTLAVIAIAFIVQLIVILTKIKAIIKKADHILNNIESAAEAIKDATKINTQKHALMSILSKLFNNKGKDK